MMVLHTIVPLEEVLRESGGTEYQYRESRHDFIQGVNCNGKFTISRIISTDPKLYLDPRYAPGEIFSEK